MGGIFSISSSGLGLLYSSENPSIIRRFFSIAKKLYGVHPEITVRENKLKKKNIYSVKISGRQVVFHILEDVGLTISGGVHADPKAIAHMLSHSCCRTSYIRGVFLACGSISNPQKIYHLEFVVNTEELASSLLNILNEYSLNAKIVQRKQLFVVYLKGIDHIITLLTLIGAHSSVLQLEDIRIMKEVRNNVNRQVNCETANLSKTVNAAYRQLENIRLIERTVGLKSLSPLLQEVAQARLENPEASLSEIAELLDMPDRRSAINHRFRKLDHIAQSLKS